MKLRNASGWVFGLITFAGCTACSTVAHYAGPGEWGVAYFLALVFAAFGGIAVMLTVFSDF